MNKLQIGSAALLLTAFVSSCASSLPASSSVSTTSTTPTSSETTSSVSTTSVSTVSTTSVTPSSEPVAAEPDLFFSEYIEGPSYNKVLEIFNPTSETVDLTAYTVKLFNNGRPITATDIIIHNLTGTLAPNETFIFHAPLSGTEAMTDTSLINAITPIPEARRWVGAYVAGSPTNIYSFNGDDSIGLFKNGVLIDVFGIIGLADTANAANDPGTSWSVTFANGDSKTEDVVLTRIPSVTGPSVNAMTYSIASTPVNFINAFNPLEWNVVAYTAVPATHTVGTHTIN